MDEFWTPLQNPISSGVIWFCLGLLASAFIARLQERRARDESKRLMEHNERLAREQAENLNRLKTQIIPQDLRIIIPVDKTGPQTSTWGKSVLYGVHEYLRQKRYMVLVNGQAYKYVVEEHDDLGERDIAKKLATCILNPEEGEAIAVIGPISTGCAEAALDSYCEVYANPDRQLIHLLPVPTGTNLLETVPKASRCIFRMPPNNRKQAETLIDTVIKMNVEEGRWKAFLLTYHYRENTYVPDLGQQLVEVAKNKFGKSKDVPIHQIEDAAQFESQTFSKYVKQELDCVIVVGPWNSDSQAPCVKEFIQAWRRDESRLGLQKNTVILLSDFPVPDACRERKLGKAQLIRDVYASFQITPDTIQKVKLFAPHKEMLSLALIAYGYDAAHLIDHTVRMSAQIKGEGLARFLFELPEFEGIAQTYEFAKDGENDKGEFHMYSFSDELSEQMPHYKSCPCQ